jgi:hypothetical protein
MTILKPVGLNETTRNIDQLQPGDTIEGLGSSTKHIQSILTNVWTAVHNLGQKEVLVETFDNAGREIIGAPDYAGATLNSIIIEFSSPVIGTAYIRKL